MRKYGWQKARKSSFFNLNSRANKTLLAYLRSNIIIMKKFLLLALLIPILSCKVNLSYAHCEIPCGIYEDQLRVKLIKEHISTIEKSMKMINELSAAENPDYNQLVRWVNNKEEHAEKIQEIVAQYFMHQRIKIKHEGEEGYEKYIEQLTGLHRISVFAMKAKQGTEMQIIAKLNNAVHRFEHAYFEDHKH